VPAEPATEDPRLARLNALCLGLPEAQRQRHGAHADFRVRKKVFAYYLDDHHGDGIVCVCCKGELGENVDRVSRDPARYTLPAYIHHRGWFGIRLDGGTIDWRDVESAVRLSYLLAAPKTLARQLDTLPLQAPNARPAASAKKRTPRLKTTAAPKTLPPAAPSAAGYSGTPLARKLGLSEGMAVHVVQAPAGYREWLAPLPAGLRWLPGLSAEAALVHLFVDERRALAEWLQRCRETLAAEAVVWVSWPKRCSKVPTDITEDTVRELALPLGYVDVKVCAVTEVWSGLKLVVRKRLR
jgi:predicted DNA-binding protein (MmcQ/YjbR family)